MIQPMNKYAFLIFHREYEAFLGELRSLGVVHVQEQKQAKEVEELQQIIRERTHLSEVLRALRPYATGKAPETTEGTETTEGKATPISSSPTAPVLRSEEEGRQLIAEVEAQLARLATLQEQRNALSQEAQEVSPWGEFSTQGIARLSEAGYTLSFFALPVSRFTEDFCQSHDVVSVSECSGKVYFVLLHLCGESPELPEAERLHPRRSIGEVEAELQATEQTIQEARGQLSSSVPHYEEALQSYDVMLENRLTFGTVRLQGDALADERLMLLEGFVPSDLAPSFEAALQARGYYFRQIDFDPEVERVPIQLKNNAFTRSFEFITELYSLPNYQEIDQTYLIAPFFMLFFGLCFGDAGYGLVLLAATTLVRLRSKGPIPSILTLLQWLGAGAFAVGLMMGGIFGIELPWAHSPVNIFSQEKMMTTSVVIGIIQVLLAKAIGAYKKGRQQGWRYSLSGFAWVLLLSSAGLAYALPMAGVILPMSVTYALYGLAGLSALVVFFYNSPGKNPLVNFGSGVWTTYETASGLLGDSLSYIRLFAIGLTGGILGGVFNQLALSCVPASGSGASVVAHVLGWLFALVILALGHGINFGIAMIGAFVHPLRLTFVEYYKNSEFEGGGKPYTPFKRK